MDSRYLLLGPEIGEKASFIDELKGSMQERFGSLDSYKHYAFDLDLAALLRELRTESLFGGARFVEIHNCEQFTRKEQFADLASIAAAGGEDAALVFVSDEVRVDGRLDALVRKDRKRIFWELFEDKKRRWVATYLRRKGFAVDDEALDVFLELVAGNTLEMAAECDHLIVMLEGKDRVGAQDVENYIFHSREESLFTLYAALLDGNTTRALESLSKLELAGQGAHGGLVGGLVRLFAGLLDFRSALDGGESAQEYFTRNKINFKRRQSDLVAGAKRFSARELSRVLSVLAQGEEDLRSTAAGLQRHLLHLLIIAVSTRRVSRRGGFLL